MIKILLFKLVSLFPILLFAQQNLIINGNFEENPICKKKILNFQLDQVNPWKTVKNTPDYYNTKGIDSLHGAHSGNAYAGILVYGAQEFFQGVLECPLIKGQKYYFEMYVKLNSIGWSGLYAIDDIDALFLSTSLENTSMDLTKFNPQITNKKNRLLSDTSSWMKISGTFTADGDEKYVIIGNFKFRKNVAIKVLRYSIYDLSLLSDTASYPYYSGYYFIDDLKLFPIDSKGKEIPINCKNDSLTKIDSFFNLKPDKPFILNNLTFATGSYEILSGSFTELNNLVDAMKKDTIVKIWISGYTDNVGNEKDNQALAENRAKAVVEYLISLGI